ncbi:MAG: RsmE family RNA methyltransferase [Armatimonadota bacterium]|nr:RsmE family RNA methyltransferase [Armatimonadota bacterium]MDR7426787.1 RsmE family RNA methyltransferase [Armatimonadota bacterium]MDR7464739.1 RsmE family RNA methyltransferase [Armatimonadota bacterium]MDR7469877.1 RsmE family RNA methyltransferase [Armatimonadota bacterium]MDR7474337.1 RsmE family RNA methyltransferase [Armatimonadota bacterium]
MTHRFLVSPGVLRGEQVVLPPAESRHAATVLRLRPGERVVVFDGRGEEADVELTAVGPRAVAGRVVARRSGVRPSIAITLVQGVPKGSKMDTIVRMGTEVGVARFVPVLTRRAVARPAAARVERWRRIAAAAAKQSGRSTVPRVDAPRPLEELWPELAGSLILLPWEGERSRSLGEVLRAHAGVGAVTICIGPEGGWSETEVHSAASHGAHPVTLGPLILRTETAGLVAAAMVLYELTLRPP